MAENEIILSILIPTIEDRKREFAKLLNNLMLQVERSGYPNQVEILYESDNREISIGAKRQKLLERSTGKWIVFFDDDDLPRQHFVYLIMKAIAANPDIDCIGLCIDMTTNGRKPQRCIHSLKYPEWKSNVDGWDFVRNITHRNPVLRELAMQVGFQDLRFGEDKPYSDAVTALCKNEYYITEVMFDYRYSTAVPHKKKYGIK